MPFSSTNSSFLGNSDVAIRMVAITSQLQLTQLVNIVGPWCFGCSSLAVRFIEQSWSSETYDEAMTVGMNLDYNFDVFGTGHSCLSLLGYNQAVRLMMALAEHCSKMNTNLYNISSI